MPHVKTHRHLLRTSDPVQILPLQVSDTRPTATSRLRKRCFRLLIILFLSCSVLVWFYGRREDLPENEEIPADHSLPPLFEAYHDYERHLPQHNLSLPFPEGRDAKFFWASNHVTASGWGNVMQELLLNALLAHETNRAFVFDNYTWARDGPEYAEYNGRLIPARIPLSVIISGPVIGSAFDPGDPTPRAVHREYFKAVCPNPTILDSDAVVSSHIRYDNSVPASRIFDMWVDKLNSINDPCVEVQLDSPQLFEIWLFGSTRILSIWPRLSKSPILRNFSWSPLVLEAFARNAHLFGATTTSFRFLPSYLRPASSPPTLKELHNVDPILPATKTDPIPGLLVLHIRRGDFDDHCAHLAKWSSDFNGFNKFATLPDNFNPPHDGGEGDTTEANVRFYLERCFPAIDQIARRVRQVLADQKKIHGATKELKRVYIMTNAEVAWLNELKEALMEIKKWDSVTSSRDLQLEREAKPVAQAMDMLVGQRADVFIGNGFSSLTSNIVMFRVLRELPPEDTRFW
ncbi:hypothetical protein JVT61DRAFT_4184 [Boletus reticuloceps]|uniref:Uncharacterized protein n=1 Tax=Boletus reticuloceps TaxID=495285 RepID=A0A8I2YMQ0_9AGAM|nr:hypothetical protein JVT61DRAFT_4184 [Boletus reticuloceps]